MPHTTTRHIIYLAALTAAAPAFAQSLFVITATGGGNSPVTVGGDSIIDLVDNAINTRGAFAPFQNATSTFSLNYGGVADAITVVKASTNTSATLTFGPTGITRIFSGTNQDDLENQIEDYLKKEGGQDYTNFLKAINAQSVIAVSDGNPNATTARMAQVSYDRFGLFADQLKAYKLDRVIPQLPTPQSEGDEQPTPEGGSQEASPAATSFLQRSRAGAQFYISASANTFEAGDFDGESTTLSSSLDFNFSQRVGISIGGWLGYNSISDADIFHGGLVLGIPIRFALPDDNSHITWQLTPHATIGGSGSEDLGAGGLIFGGGLTNYLAWHIDGNWTIAMANQISMFEGEKLEFDEFEIDPGVSQTMAKNGVRVTYRFSDQWYALAGATYSNFLDDAAIESWITPTAGLGYGTLAGTSLQFNVFADIGDDYDAVGARLSANFAF